MWLLFFRKTLLICDYCFSENLAKTCRNLQLKLSKAQSKANRLRWVFYVVFHFNIYYDNDIYNIFYVNFIAEMYIKILMLTVIWRILSRNLFLTAFGQKLPNLTLLWIIPKLLDKFSGYATLFLTSRKYTLLLNLLQKIKKSWSKICCHLSEIFLFHCVFNALYYFAIVSV